MGADARRVSRATSLRNLPFKTPQFLLECMGVVRRGRNSEFARMRVRFKVRNQQPFRHVPRLRVALRHVTSSLAVIVIRLFDPAPHRPEPK